LEKIEKLLEKDDNTNSEDQHMQALMKIKNNLVVQTSKGI
jgi:hypothetical protein